ncbi:hypothetical protein KVE48_01055 [Helicobacter pylori]|nr:hypothetical protein KVE48_01055 [Helicobacter pylori]
MRKFSDPIVAEFSNDGKRLRLVEGFEYDLFLESMLEVKAFSVFKAVLIYCAVRLFAKVKGLK